MKKPKFMKINPEWVTNLKIGDVVCDSKYRHLAIIEIEDEYWATIPMWLKNIVTFWLYLPDWTHKYLPSADLILDPLEKLYEFLGWEEVYDRCLTLSDGSICSARHCCSPVEQKPNTL